MLKRREFLLHSMAVATAASTGMLAAASSSAAIVSPAAPGAIHFALFDEEFEDSVLFARELCTRGARAFSVQQDLGQLWFGELGEAFTGGRAIAGLTTHSELLICADFARRHGARVRYEGAHDCRGADVLTHSLRVTPSLGSISHLLAEADANWPRVLAARLSGMAMGGAPQADDCCQTTTQRSPSNPGSLFSWVIA